MAVYYLPSRKKCDVAAFYMGAITHLIADMASWPHVLHYRKVTGSLEPSHPNFEHAVGEVNRDHVHRVVEGGFTYPMNFPIIILEPIVALKLVGFETHWDYKISQEDYYTKPYPTYITPGLDNALEIYDTFSYYSETEQIRIFLNFVPIFCENWMER